MSQPSPTAPLPRLRSDLDFLPSPIADRPGLLVRDPYRYSPAVMVVPPLLLRCLPCFDGQHSEVDLRNQMVQLTGRPDAGNVSADLARALSEAGFLDDHVHAAQRGARWAEFAAAPIRQAAFAGGGYPDDPRVLDETLGGWMGDEAAPSPADTPNVLGIAAPHVSPSGGISTYRAAYRTLASADRDAVPDRTIVLLGTSHYGHPNRFGLTRKPFETPLGRVETNVSLVDELAGTSAAAFEVEDYCHAIEHSIEFQVLFLQRVLGAGTFKILPILCGPFANADRAFDRPEDNRGVAGSLEALGRLQAAHVRRLRWVLGVDLSHVGRRYGHPIEARARDPHMTAVELRDRARLDRVTAGDADGFWKLVHEQEGDDLNWCGSAPLYTFLRAVPGAKGQVVHYDQWNIDDASVVSFAALSFTAP